MKKHYQIHFFVLKEVDEKLGKLLNHHAKGVIKEIVNLDWEEINKESIDIVNEFYKEAIKHREVGIYVDEEIHKKWKSIPRGIKKHAQFLINKKLYLIATNKEKAIQSNPLSFLKKIEEIKA